MHKPGCNDRCELSIDRSYTASFASRRLCLKFSQFLAVLLACLNPADIREGAQRQDIKTAAKAVVRHTEGERALIIHLCSNGVDR